MAYTQISDVIIPENWLPYVVERTATLSKLVTSGIVVNSPEMDALAAKGGQTVQMPFWNDLTGSDEIEADSDATPGKIGTSRDVAVMFERRKAWEHLTLAGILAGDDPFSQCADLVGDFWQRQMQDRLISMLKGVFAIGTMASHVSGIHYTGSGSAPNTDNFLTGRSFIDALQKLGDNKSVLTSCIMHSAVEASLAKQDLIDFAKDSDGNATIPTFMGKTVIVDDGMPVQTVSGAAQYTTYLFGRGAIALGYDRGKATEAVPGGHGTWGAEFYRVALGGRSGMINRQKFILHPRGIKWLGGAMAGASPTNTELENAANWLRVFESKHVPIVAVTHNIDL